MAKGHAPRRQGGVAAVPAGSGGGTVRLDRLVASWKLTAAALGALAVGASAVPELAPAALAAGGWLAWRRLGWLDSYPLKVPQQQRLADPNQPHPATGQPVGGKGILFLGHEHGSGKEVWLTASDARQHFLTLGVTGAGKTEFLLGMAANALSWGSGFIFIDGKGDVGLFARVQQLAHRFNRTDDVLVLNFMLGNAALPGRARLSHRMNPFLRGSSDSLCQLVTSMMDDVGGDGALWKGRATALLAAVLRALTWLRDHDGLNLAPGVVRDHVSLTRVLALADDDRLPDGVRRSLRSYLTSLPGFQWDRGYKQSQTTLDQHGYLEMQTTKVLGSIADVYGHIFEDGGTDVDMRDVVANRRILVIMLPALEKSGDEISNLGKIVVSTLKAVMGGTLGSSIEGDWAEVVENRPTNAATPFLCIFEEAGYYMVDGMALMAAQARALGFSMVYASQDIPSMKRLSDREAQAVIANTNTKIFMRAEDPGLLGSFPWGPLLKEQREGEAHVVFQDKAVRVRGFYPILRDRNVKLRLADTVSLDWDALADSQSQEAAQ